MSPIAIALTLIASFLHVLRDFQTKKAHDKQIFIWWFSAISLVFSLPLAIYFVWRDGINLISVLAALAMGIIHFSYWTSYAKAYEHGDLSHIYPIIRSSPALVLIFAIIFLQEKVTLLGIIGILTITFGVYTLNLKKFSLKALFAPILSIPKEKHTRWAFIGMLLVGIYTILDRMMITNLNPVVYGFIITFSACNLFGIYLLKTKSLDAFKVSWKTEKNDILLNGVFAAIVYPLILYTYTFANVSYVSALRQISVVLAVLVGSHVLKEQQKVLRLICSVIIVTGAIMIALA